MKSDVGQALAWDLLLDCFDRAKQENWDGELPRIATEMMELKRGTKYPVPSPAMYDRLMGHCDNLDSVLANPDFAVSKIRQRFDIAIVEWANTEQVSTRYSRTLALLYFKLGHVEKAVELIERTNPRLDKSAHPMDLILLCMCLKKQAKESQLAKVEKLLDDHVAEIKLKAGDLTSRVLYAQFKETAVDSSELAMLSSKQSSGTLLPTTIWPARSSRTIQLGPKAVSGGVF